MEKPPTRQQGPKFVVRQAPQEGGMPRAQRLSVETPPCLAQRGRQRTLHPSLADQGSLAQDEKQGCFRTWLGRPHEACRNCLSHSAFHRREGSRKLFQEAPVQELLLSPPDSL